MKSFKILILVASVFLSSNLFAQSVGINADGSAPESSAMLDISAKNKGLLIPQIRLTGINDATTIPSPAASLLIFNLTTSNNLVVGYYYNAGPPEAPVWTKLASGTLTTGPTGPQGIQGIQGIKGDPGSDATVPNADANTLGKLKLTGDLAGSALSPTVPGLNLKESLVNKSSNLIADGTSDVKYPSVKSVKTYVDAQVASATIVDADAVTKGKIQLAGDLDGTAAAPTVPGLALKAPIASPTFTGAPSAPTPTIGDNSSKLATTAFVMNSITGATVNDASNAAKGIVQLAGDLDGTAAAPTVPGLALKEDLGNKSIITTLGTSDLLYPSQNAVKTYVDTQVASATIADADATTKGKIQLAGDLGGTAASPTVPGLALKAPIASPTFTGTVTATTYASTPQALAAGSNIAWDPANGLNASVTLDQNSTLIFTTPPNVGTYGTVVLTQDATGGRTITLPTIVGKTNKVLGSTSTTTVTLSSAANAQDILNFYYDGTTCYWNIGQGYGQTKTASSTDLATGVTGTLPVANGGTGATTLTGLVKGTGTNALSAAVAGTDYLEPNGSAASLTNFPTFNQNTTGNAANVTGIVAVVNGGTGTTTANGAFNALAPAQSSNSGKYLTTDGTNTSWGTVASVLPTTVNTSANYNIVMATGQNLALVTGTGHGGNAATLNPYTGQMNLSGLTAQGYGITSTFYASTPRALTPGSTIAWDPILGLNASVTLDQNSTLSFPGNPAAGSYGTLVVTQDVTGGRTITLPSSTTNKVLGSTATNTIALSSAAGAKDIVNFYYDGTICYWNIGQGYGQAATAASTNLASSVTGTLPVANGGTGATTLTGLVKGTGTSALSAAVAGTDYLAPNGSASSLTNFPTLNQNTTGNAVNVTGTVAVANGGTGSTTQNFVDITTTQTVAGIKSFSSSMAVGTASSPVSSAALEVASSTKGFLPPRMTAAQRNAITSPEAGLIVWCSNCSMSGELEVYNGSSWTNVTGGATQAAFSVGASYGGGIVAYILQPGDPGYNPSVLHGLIITSANIGTNVPWACDPMPINGAIGTSIGTGQQNTNEILAALALQGCSAAGKAAYLCDVLVEGGYSDWYLPSLDELSKIATNRTAIGGFTSSWYWSSTKHVNIPEPNRYAKYVSFYTGDVGTIGYHFNTTGCSVRAVRSF